MTAMSGDLTTSALPGAARAAHAAHAAHAVHAARCLLAVAVLAAAAAMAVTANAAAMDSPRASTGAIIGVVINADKLPVPRATVTAVKVDGSSFHAVLSGPDGSYAFSDLTPGSWTVSAHMDGYPDMALPQVQVDANAATRSDLVLNLPESKAAPAVLVTEGLQAPEPGPEVDDQTPFAFGDFTWLNGSPRNHAPAFDTRFFTPDIRIDAYFTNDFEHPVDHTIVGSTEEFRSGEFQLEQVSFGGDFHWENVTARVLTMQGLFATTIARNDGSSGNIGGVGQWDLQDAYRYLSEANAGYHWDVQHGLNIQIGIFASYIGLFSFYNYDNWAYQPSYVSSNTPWVFNGMRLQWYPTNKLKIEPWLINGWASYARFNSHPGVGAQIEYLPTENVKWVFNQYAVGQDNLANNPGNPLQRTQRIHADDSLLVKYYENHDAGNGIDKAAFSFTFDMGCQYGGGITCTGGPNKSNFIGWMLYDRYWFYHDLFAVTLGGGAMNNPGRYLALLPPINGATASTGTPYFSESPGQGLYQWDSTLTFQYMPREWVTWWSELGYRHSNVPYFNGPGGVTPAFGNNGAPADYVCNSGASSGYGSGSLSEATAACAGQGGVWFPDLVTHEAMWSAGILIKF
jgi:hypothetical protein